MLASRAVLLVPLLLCIAAACSTEPVYLTTEELCRRQARYVCESHVVRTADGYLLTMYRLFVDGGLPTDGHGAGPPGGAGPPVLVQHGLFMASDSWVLADRHNSLGFLLADQGYDVWLGNLRGNAFSRNHSSLSPNHKQFWKFTWHEMGVWDLPAAVDHIRRSRDIERREDGRLLYVGHSMGSTALLVACSELPGFAARLRGAVLLAPAAFMSRSSNTSPLLSALMILHDLLWDMFYSSGQYECLESNRRLSRIVRMCDRSKQIRWLCEAIYDVVLGHSYFGVNKTLALTFLAHVPTGSSIYTVDHFTQLMKSGKFQHYDYSISGRINKKSTVKVAEYDLKKVTPPIAIYYSRADMFINADDVLELSHNLPNLITLHEVEDPSFDHLSFLVGNNVRKLLYDKILADLRTMLS